MTLAAMRSRIYEELPNEDFTDAQVNRAIASAIAHYERRPFYFNQNVSTFVTVAAQEYYAAAALAAIPDIKEIRNALVTINGQKSQLKSMDYESVDDVQDGTITGQPLFYTLFKKQIRIYPIPDAVYTITLSFIKMLGDNDIWTDDAEELIRQSTKRRLCLDILHADDIAARCAVLEKEAFDELLAETRRRLPGMMLRTETPLLSHGFNINRGY